MTDTPKLDDGASGIFTMHMMRYLRHDGGIRYLRVRTCAVGQCLMPVDDEGRRTGEEFPFVYKPTLPARARQEPLWVRDNAGMKVVIGPGAYSVGLLLAHGLYRDSVASAVDARGYRVAAATAHRMRPGGTRVKRHVPTVRIPTDWIRVAARLAAFRPVTVGVCGSVAEIWWLPESGEYATRATHPRGTTQTSTSINGLIPLVRAQLRLCRAD